MPNPHAVLSRLEIDASNLRRVAGTRAVCQARLAGRQTACPVPRRRVHTLTPRRIRQLVVLRTLRRVASKEHSGRPQIVSRINVPSVGASRLLIRSASSRPSAHEPTEVYTPNAEGLVG